MKNSRALSDLHPKVAALAEELKARCAVEGIHIIITATLRDVEYQNELYAQGRTKPGKIVTNAKGGLSFHNYGVAFDVVPLKDNMTAMYETSGEFGKVWAKVGTIGESIGLEWGGNWKFKDMPHFQYIEGLTLADFRAGKTIKAVA